MTRFESEARPRKPPEFNEWLAELALIAETEGQWMLINAIWYSPPSCHAYVMTLPGVWAELFSQARYTDLQRYANGVSVARVLRQG